MTVTISQYRLKIGYFDFKSKPKRFQKIDTQINSNISDQHFTIFQYYKILLTVILLTSITNDIFMTKTDTMNTMTNLSHNTILYTLYDYDNIVLYFSNILGCNSFLNPTPLSHKDRNELQKIYNGNRCCTKSINIVHFNKGNSKFENR